MAVTTADAAIVYSGVVSISIPDNIDGVYLNVVTGASGAVLPAGWDVNPYTAAAGQFNLWECDGQYLVQQLQGSSQDRKSCVRNDDWWCCDKLFPARGRDGCRTADRT